MVSAQISHLVSLLLDPSKAQEALVGLAEYVDDERQRGHIRRYELWIRVDFRVI
jgi:hypothetical protein